MQLVLHWGWTVSEFTCWIAAFLIKIMMLMTANLPVWNRDEHVHK